MELTASYKCSRVSGNGDLKYSSRANNKRGFNFNQLLYEITLECQEAKTGVAYLIDVKKWMPCTNRHCFYYRTSMSSIG